MSLAERISRIDARTLDVDAFEREVLISSQDIRTRQSLSSLGLVLVSGIAYVISLWDRTDNLHLSLWILMIFLSTGVRAIVSRRVQQTLTAGADSRQLLDNELKLWVTGLSSPFILGIGYWLVCLPGDEHTVFAVTLLTIMYGVGTTVNSLTAIRALPLLLLVNLGQGVLFFSGLGNRSDFAISITLGATLLLLLLFARRNSDAFRESIRMRLENQAQNLELTRQKELIQHALDSAMEANQSKSRFLAAASHDLRQPLHAMTLFIGSLKATQQSEKQQSLTRRIEETAELLRVQFNGILDLSRFDAGGVRIQVRPFDMRELIESMSETLAPEAEARGLDFRWQGPSFTVTSDPLLLERLVRNLAANAIRYTNQGSVQVSFRRDGIEMVIEVRDTGIGIAPEDQSRIFDEFAQLNNPARRRSEGTGLGLAIVARIAGLLQGSIQVESEPGQGSVFTVRLPVELQTREVAAAGTGTAASSEDFVTPVAVPGIAGLPVPDDIPAMSPDTAQAPGPDGRFSQLFPSEEDGYTELPSTVRPRHALSLDGRVILAVDDDEAILDALGEYIDMRGGEAVLCNDPHEVSRLLADHRVDFAILDDMLHAERSGLEVAREAAATLDTRRVIIVTGSEAPERLQAIRENGFSVFRKPLRGEHLDAILYERLFSDPVTGRAADPIPG